MVRGHLIAAATERNRCPLPVWVQGGASMQGFSPSKRCRGSRYNQPRHLNSVTCAHHRIVLHHVGMRLRHLCAAGILHHRVMRHGVAGLDLSFRGPRGLHRARRRHRAMRRHCILGKGGCARNERQRGDDQQGSTLGNVLSGSRVWRDPFVRREGRTAVSSVGWIASRHVLADPSQKNARSVRSTGAATMQGRGSCHPVRSRAPGRYSFARRVMISKDSGVCCNRGSCDRV